MNDQEIERHVLEIEPSTPIEKIAEALAMAEAFKQRAAEIVDLCKAHMTEWITANNKAIEWKIDGQGHVRRFYLAEDSTTKCVDPKLAFETLMEFDVNDVLCCLSSNAWKPGATKKLLVANGRPELFDQLFQEVFSKKIAEDKPVKKLQCVDTRFLR